MIKSIKNNLILFIFLLNIPLNEILIQISKHTLNKLAFIYLPCYESYERKKKGKKIILKMTKYEYPAVSSLLQLIGMRAELQEVANLSPIPSSFFLSFFKDVLLIIHKIYYLLIKLFFLLLLINIYYYKKYYTNLNFISLKYYIITYFKNN